ncbi:hypothetical protein AKJ13_27805 [Methylobacterium sp. ARG-1]|nr:hypothetical protein AKJ13_27805 [Methylobacterium sp. ARG-1]
MLFDWICWSIESNEEVDTLEECGSHMTTQNTLDIHEHRRSIGRDIRFCLQLNDDEFHLLASLSVRMTFSHS